MDALIFDFDGVVVDSEPIHLQGFQQVIATVGVTLTREAYYQTYLGYDDHDCFLIAARDQGVALDEDRIAQLTADKTRLVQEIFSRDVRALPGAAELIASAAAAGVPVGVCSGALREEIELAAATVGVREHFQWIVAALDVRHGKPDPEGYVQSLQRARDLSGREIRPQRSVVVEDSPAGIAAAKAAGCRVLAVTNSYPAAELRQADRIVASLADVTLADLEALAAS